MKVRNNKKVSLRAGSFLSLVLLLLICGKSMALNIEDVDLGQSKFDANKISRYRVNVTTGNMTYRNTDLHIPGRGIDFDFTRIYNSKGAEGSLFGGHWTHSFTMKLGSEGEIVCDPEDPDPDEITAIVYQDEEGSKSMFQEGLPLPPLWYPYKFDSDTNPGKVIYKSGKICNFGLYGIESIEDRNGNSLSFEYESYDRWMYRESEHQWVQISDWYRLKTISDTVGRAITLTYYDYPRPPTPQWPYYFSVHRVVSIEVTNPPGTNVKCDYLYDDDPDHKLIKVILPPDEFGNRPETQYAYHSYQTQPPYPIYWTVIDEITEPNGSEVHFNYANTNIGWACTKFYRTVDGQEVEGASYQYYGQDDPDWRTEVTDLRGNTTKKYIAKYDSPPFVCGEGGETNHIVKVRDPYDKDTIYQWENMKIVSSTDTNNVAYEKEYDQWNNMTVKRHVPTGDEIAYTYTHTYTDGDIICKPSTATDENIHTTTYTYDGRGNLTYKKDPKLNETTYLYNEHGQCILKTEFDPTYGNHITDYEYNDPYDNLTDVKVHYGNEQIAHIHYDYDELGNKTKEIDANGHVTEYSYDKLNRLIEVKDHLGKTIHYLYDGNGNKIAEKDKNNNWTHYEYDGANRLKKVIDPLGNETSYAYDTERNKTAETNARGYATTYQYDELNRLKKEIDADGKETEYFYDGAGNNSTVNGTVKYDRSKDKYTRVVNPRGTETSYNYNNLYRLEKVTDDLNNETEYGFDAAGNKLWEEDANDKRTNYEYYNNNWLKKITDPILPTPGVVEYEYDSAGNKSKETDKRGNRIKYYYDERNLLERIEYMDAVIDDSTYSYDAVGNKVSETNSNGHITDFEYDVLNRIIATIDPLGNKAAISYDSNGNKVSETDPNGNRTTYTYDALNRVTSKTIASGRIPGLTTAYRYDEVGNRVKIVDAMGVETSYTYDKLNRLTDVLDGKGYTTHYDYDEVGNKTLTTDAKGIMTKFEYDSLNRLTKKIEDYHEGGPNGRETSYTYDGVGNRTYLEQANGKNIQYEHDPLNRLTTRTFGDSIPDFYITYVYDKNGNRISMTDPVTGTTSYEYDTINRWIETETPDGNTVEYIYDGVGNRLEMIVNSLETTSYEYDDANRLLYLTKGDDTTAYCYDSGGRLLEMVYPHGAVASYAYDAANRLVSSVTINPLAPPGGEGQGEGGNKPIATFTYTYDKVGNKLTMTDMRGTTTYEYDDLYRLTHVIYPDGNDESYIYDGVGNRLTKSGSLADASYSYNSLNQLTSKTETRKAITVSGDVSDNSGIEGVTVNGVDAIMGSNTFYAVNVPVTPNQQNTLTAEATDTAGNKDTDEITVQHMGSSTTTYAYDDNGNLETKTISTSGMDDEGTTYEYDYENRLTKATLHDSRFTRYEYDGDKRRVSRTDKEGAVTKFLYDGLNILKDLNGMGEEIASYVQGVGLDSLISREENSEVAYFHADALGSTRVMTDSNQETVAQYDFDVWGKELVGTGATSNEYTFTGRRKEDDIGLMYYRARFYDPEIGRFTTPDPLTGGPDDPTISYLNNVYLMIHKEVKELLDSRNPHKLNRYVYCYNNPINKRDPLGLEPESRSWRDWIGDVFLAAGEALSSVSDSIRSSFESQYDMVQDPQVSHVRDQVQAVTSFPTDGAALALSSLGSLVKGEEKSAVEKTKDILTVVETTLDVVEGAKSLTGGEGQAEPQGGAAKDVPSAGGEVHHMPADSVSPLKSGEGPGIRMEKKDHQKTASWGKKKEAQVHRTKQSELIKKEGLEGFKKAQQMDIKDVRKIAGPKYDEGLKQMEKYTEELDFD